MITNYWEKIDREWDLWESNGFTPEEANLIKDCYPCKDVENEVCFYGTCKGMDAQKIARGYKLYDDYRKNLG